MANYTYKATCSDIVNSVEQFLNDQEAMIKTAHAFSDQFNLGRPGFSRDLFLWTIQCCGIEMDRRVWNQSYQADWYCPTKGFSKPKPPKKGQISEVYDAYQDIPKAQADSLRKLLIGDSGSLWAPGFFIHKNAAYIETGGAIETRNGLTEITSTEYEEAKKELMSC